MDGDGALIDGRRPGRNPKMPENSLNRTLAHDGGDDFHLSAAMVATFRVDIEDAAKEPGPRHTLGFRGCCDPVFGVSVFGRIFFRL